VNAIFWYWDEAAPGGRNLPGAGIEEFHPKNSDYFAESQGPAPATLGRAPIAQNDGKKI
jgi:hypothetical protein